MRFMSFAALIPIFGRVEVNEVKIESTIGVLISKSIGISTVSYVSEGSEYVGRIKSQEGVNGM